MKRHNPCKMLSHGTRALAVKVNLKIVFKFLKIVLERRLPVWREQEQRPGRRRRTRGHVCALPQGRWPGWDRPRARRGPRGAPQSAERGRAPCGRDSAGAEGGPRPPGRAAGWPRGDRARPRLAQRAGSVSWPARRIPRGARPAPSSRALHWQADLCALGRPRYSPSVPVTPLPRSPWDPLRETHEALVSVCAAHHMRKINAPHFSEPSSRKNGLQLPSLIFNLHFINFF